MEKTANCISGLDWYRAGYWAIFAVAVLLESTSRGCSRKTTPGAPASELLGIARAG